MARTLETALWLVPLVAALGAYVLALGYDEAWYLTDIRHLVEGKGYGGTEVAPAWTSGGLYTAGVALLSALSGGQLWVVRLLSVASIAALLWTAVRWGTALHGDRVEGLLSAVWIVALPGTLTFAGTAYATLPATALVIGGAFAWARLDPGSWARWIVPGVVFGAAIATRWNCVFLLPALACAAFTGVGDRRRELADAIVAGAVATAVALALVGVLVGISVATPGFYQANVGATGFGAMLLDYPRQLNKWNLSQDFLPLPVMVAATLLWWGATRRLGGGAQGGARGLDFVPWFAWILWGAWLSITFVGHLRYLWPALAAFALMLGYALAALHRWGRDRDDPRLRAAALAIGLACLATGYASTLRAYVNGSNDVLSWEWSGYSARVMPYGLFDHWRDQRATAAVLAERLHSGEQVLAIGEPLQLAYLSRREIRNWASYARDGDWDPTRLPRTIVVTPDIGGYHALQPEAIRWFEEGARLRASFGAFAIYDVIGDYPSDPNLFIALPPPVSPPLVPHPSERWIEPIVPPGVGAEAP